MPFSSNQIHLVFLMVMLVACDITGPKQNQPSCPTVISTEEHRTISSSISDATSRDPGLVAFLSFQQTQRVLLDKTKNSEGVFVWDENWKKVTDASFAEFQFPDGALIVKNRVLGSGDDWYELWVTLPTGQTYSEQIYPDGSADGGGRHEVGKWKGEWNIAEASNPGRSKKIVTPFGVFESFLCTECFETGGMNYAAVDSRKLKVEFVGSVLHVEEKTESNCAGCDTDSQYVAIAVYNQQPRLDIKGKNLGCNLDPMFNLVQSASKILDWDRFPGTRICDTSKLENICDFRR